MIHRFVLPLLLVGSLGLSACNNPQLELVQKEQQKRAIAHELERARYEHRVATVQGYVKAQQAAQKRIGIYESRLKALG